MTFYSDDNVSTKYVDPQTYVPGVRASWELDISEAAYLPNMRVGFLGVSNTSDNEDYNRLLGALAQCRNWRLMDGKTELCASNVAQFHRGFQSQGVKNAHTEAVTSNMNCNAVGFTVEGVDLKVGRVATVLQSMISPSATHSAWLDLRDIFPMLNSVSHLPTAVFENLRIEVEFDVKTPTSQVLVDTTKVLTTLRPLLMVDVLTNPVIVDKLNGQLQTASWLEVEHDQFLIPQTTLDGAAGDQLLVQPTNVKLNGFNNKRIERLLMVKEIADPAKEIGAGLVLGYGKYSSQACFRQKIQVRVNGSNILPRNGLTQNNERTATLIDTFGDQANYIGSNQYGGVGGFASVVSAGSGGASLLGQLDYVGLYVGDYINDLQIQYERTGLHDTALKRATTSAIVSHVYCEVQKILTVGKGGYNISYAQ